MKGLYTYGAVPLSDIILAPMEAIVQADIALSDKITKFIIWYGFENGTDEESGFLGNIKHITFSYTDNKSETKALKIPALSLIQLPLLKISHAAIDMDLKIVTAESEDPSEWPSLTDTESNKKRSRAVLKGFLTPETNHTGRHLTTNTRMKLNLSEGDMPGGIIKLLSLINQIQPQNTAL